MSDQQRREYIERARALGHEFPEEPFDPAEIPAIARRLFPGGRSAEELDIEDHAGERVFAALGTSPEFIPRPAE